MIVWLWFGDERGYNATIYVAQCFPQCCGLVMKEDITQHTRTTSEEISGCGLVMKEDITQHTQDHHTRNTVVVW